MSIDNISRAMIIKIQKDLDTLMDILQPTIIRGNATNGGNDFVEDTTKTWNTDEFAGKTIKFEINGKKYYAAVISNTTNTISFTPINNISINVGDKYEIAYSTLLEN